VISLGCSFSYSKLGGKGNGKGHRGAGKFCPDAMLAHPSQVIENKKNFQLIVPIA
jgi:hypothetical protein